ncbi:MAG: CvpA family protein [Rhodospirillaceae bacterium]
MRNMEALSDLPVNVVDLVVLTVLLISAIFAYARGFIHEVLSIGGWIGAIFATLHGFRYAQPYARDLIPIQLAADLAAGVAIFIFTLLSLSIIIRWISRHIQQSSLNVLDRSLGFLFGLLRGAIIICVAYLGLEFLMSPAEQPKWVKEAKSMPLVIQGADAIRALIPDDLGGKIKAATPKGLPSVPLSKDEALKKMLAPKPATPERANPDGAYSDKERTDINRAIENAAEPKN